MRINYYQVGLGVDWFHPQSRGAVHLIPLNILEVSILVIVIVMMKKSLSLVLALNLSSRFPFWWCCFVIIHGWLDNGWWNWHLKTDSSSLVNWTGHLFMNFSHWFDCRPFLSFTCLTCCIPSWNLSLSLSLFALLFHSFRSRCIHLCEKRWWLYLRISLEKSLLVLSFSCPHVLLLHPRASSSTIARQGLQNYVWKIVLKARSR